MSETEFATFIHAYQIFPERQTSLQKKISLHFGMIEADFEDFEGFNRRMTEICDLNAELKSYVFLDAEQTYI